MAAKAFAASRVVITDIRPDTFAVAHQVRPDRFFGEMALAAYRQDKRLHLFQPARLITHLIHRLDQVPPSFSRQLQENEQLGYSMPKACQVLMYQGVQMSDCTHNQPAFGLKHCGQGQASPDDQLQPYVCMAGVDHAAGDAADGVRLRGAMVQLGVGATLLTPPSLDPARIAEELVRLLPPDGPDVVIDCAGFDSTVQVGTKAVLPEICSVCQAQVSF